MAIKDLIIPNLKEILDLQEKEFDKNFDYASDMNKDDLKSFFRSSQNQLIQKLIEECEGMKKNIIGKLNPNLTMQEKSWVGSGYNQALQKVIDYLRGIKE